MVFVEKDNLVEVFGFLWLSCGEGSSFIPGKSVFHSYFRYPMCVILLHFVSDLSGTLNIACIE
jgi:hypothetical protein